MLSSLHLFDPFVDTFRVRIALAKTASQSSNDVGGSNRLFGICRLDIICPLFQEAIECRLQPNKVSA
jgi:hypothetical protein